MSIGILTMTASDLEKEAGIDKDSDHSVDSGSFERLRKLETTASNLDFNELTPYVRYAESDDSGSPIQKPWLHSIHDFVPNDAKFASPIYLLTTEQEERLDRRSHPWTSDSNIAYELQEECEDSGHVLYPIAVESDAGDKGVALSRMRDAIMEFISNYINFDPFHCSWYFSGHRSIHAHLPLVVQSKDELDILKKATKDFNNDSDIALDAKIYSTKRPFRLPGVLHDETGLAKTSINPAWPIDTLQKKAVSIEATRPHTYLDILENILSKRGGRGNQLAYDAGSAVEEFYRWNPNTPYIKENLPGSIETPLEERQRSPGDPESHERWKQYNRKEFSPYANTRGPEGGRSVAIIRVMDGAFARKDVRERTTLVPARIYGAVGGDGEHTIWEEFGPIQISEIDYQKREWNKGDVLVIIGGGNGESIIHEVDTGVREWVVHKLLELNRLDYEELQEFWRSDARTYDVDGRAEALQALEKEGYDIGSAGKNGPHRTSRTSTTRSNTTEQFRPRISSSGYRQSKAARLQRRAEQGDVLHDLDHQDRLDVGNRLLQLYGWEGAWQWFKNQFGHRFDPADTHKHLRSIVQKFDDLSHIDIPPKHEVVKDE